MVKNRIKKENKNGEPLPRYFLLNYQWSAKESHGLGVFEDSRERGFFINRKQTIKKIKATLQHKIPDLKGLEITVCITGINEVTKKDYEAWLL